MVAVGVRPRAREPGRRPRGLIFSKDGKRLFVCASDSDAVQVIDPDSGKVLHNLPSGEDPEQFALSPDGKSLFIANENNAATTRARCWARSMSASSPKAWRWRLTTRSP